jgi:membrane-bound metal-dependent hydrolase YbcI (DUF457 family)
MPTPVGHVLGALSVHLVTAEGEAARLDRARALAVIAAAVAPDLDLLFKLVDGRNHHNNETHSIGAAAIAGLCAWAWARWRARVDAGRFGLAVAAGWFSHVVLDYVNKDTNPPIGIMALWPFSDAHYKLPWPLLRDVWRHFSLEATIHNLITVAWEVAVLLPILLITARLTLRRGH